MDLDKHKIEVALARGLALLMEQETAHAFRTKQWGGRAWKPSNISANLLINSSMLRNSIHHTAVGNQVEVSSPLPYANIHNEGGRIPITPKMRAFFWARYKEPKDHIYKACALTKKTHIDIPQRQFTGVSQYTDEAFAKLVDQTLSQLDLLGSIKAKIKR